MQDYDSLSVVDANKKIAKMVSVINNSKLSAAYELLSRMSGFKDWNTAKALGVDFRECIVYKVKIKKE